MEKSKNPVWVLAEHRDGKIDSISFQLIGQAKKLADESGASTEVFLLGDSIVHLAADLISAGADTVYLAESHCLSTYQADLYVNIISELAREQQPSIFLIGSTCMGRELAPLLAAKLETGLTAHCIDLALDENGILEQSIPAYGGLISIICPEKRPQMATIAKGVFPMPDLDNKRNGDIKTIHVPNDIQCRVKTLEILCKESKGVPLESASIVVAGGAGAVDTEGWNSIVELADTLEAALGCTRPVVDEGWSDLETMIGQSGKMVNPELYIGVGLSGELQHMVGIVGAKVMVAINNDAKSPVFDQVDCGVVDDCREFLPVLIKKIKEKKDQN